MRIGSFLPSTGMGTGLLVDLVNGKFCFPDGLASDNFLTFSAVLLVLLVDLL